MLLQVGSVKKIQHWRVSCISQTKLEQSKIASLVDKRQLNWKFEFAEIIITTSLGTIIGGSNRNLLFICTLG